MLVQSALKHPGTTSVFLSYTRKTARDTLERPLAALLRKLQLQYELHRTDLVYTLENGSKIALQGADKDDQIEKLRGKAYPLVVLDECGHGDFASRLDYIVNEVIEPAVAQFDGSIVLIGTSSAFVDTLFYRVTSPSPTEPGWSVHRWSWEDNTTKESNARVCDQVRKTLAARLQRDPLYVETDGYKREWLGEWCIDENELVYRFNADRNLTPNLPDADYNHILAVDLGSRDATAFVIAAYSWQDPTLYIIRAEKKQHLDFTQVATRCKELIAQYHPVHYVIDGANLQGVEEIRNRHRIPFKATPKAPNYKYTAIQLMNADLQSQRVKLLAHQTQPLINEYKTLTWDERNPTKENQSQKNDLCDAALYAYLESRHYLSQTPNHETPIEPNEAPRRYFDILPSDQDTNLFDLFDLQETLAKL